MQEVRTTSRRLPMAPLCQTGSIKCMQKGQKSHRIQLAIREPKQAFTNVFVHTGHTRRLPDDACTGSSMGLGGQESVLVLPPPLPPTHYAVEHVVLRFEAFCFLVWLQAAPPFYWRRTGAWSTDRHVWQDLEIVRCLTTSLNLLTRQHDIANEIGQKVAWRLPEFPGGLQ